MVDCTGSNASTVHKLFQRPQMVAWYGTGNSGVPWSSQDRALFAGSVMVCIDQGGAGSPLPYAVVRDVESGAWTVGNAVNRTGWLAARPTIYCDLSTLPRVLSAGWHGDLWLAIPDYSLPSPPSVPGCNVVAVQRVYATLYDLSAVYDPTWPSPQPQEEKMIRFTAADTYDGFAVWPTGYYHEIWLYRDFVSPASKATVRVALRSESRGYIIEHFVLDYAHPTVWKFPYPDCNCVSVVLESGPTPVTATIA